MDAIGSFIAHRRSKNYNQQLGTGAAIAAPKPDHKRHPAIALSGPGRWTYVYGRMTPEDAAEIRQGAADYAASNDGIVPWRDRIAIFRKRSLARIPPLG